MTEQGRGSKFAGSNKANRFEYVDRWAIIVGISDYQDESIDLDYAHRDAEELYKLLQTPLGGGFEENHIVKLINKDATTANITRALRSFLKKPAEQDIVLIYFACHGAPDFDRPDIIYLLTYDTDPNDISGTALPMREIDLSLRENLLAKRVIIIADTCHSGAIGGGIGSKRSQTNNSAEVNRYLSEISKTQEGIALLTSAAAIQTARESKKWGDGHGVFTYYLLEGMRGAADVDKNGVVTVGELFDYVSKMVRAATDNLQHPTVGTNKFDPNLPIAITGKADGYEHYRLGCQLYKMGAVLGDAGRYASAIRQFALAITLTLEPFPEAHLQLGRSLLALGDYKAAIKSFRAVKQGEHMALLSYYLGVAYAKWDKYDAAAEAFKRYYRAKPNDELVPFVKNYISFLEKSERKFALLIGNDIQDSPLINSSRIPMQSTAIDDLILLEKVLMKFCKFQAENIIMVSGTEATKQNILNAFATLSNKVGRFDTVLVHICGRSNANRDDNYTLFPYDYYAGEGREIGGKELHDLLNSIPANHKFLTLDTNGVKLGKNRRDFLKLAQEHGTYTLIMGASTGQYARETNYSIDNVIKPYSAFSYYLAEQLKSYQLDVEGWEQSITSMVKALEEKLHNQTPVLIKNSNTTTKIRDYFLWLLDFIEKRNFLSLEVNELQTRLERLDETALFNPRIQYCFGLALFQHAAYSDAIKSLQVVARQSFDEDRDVDLILGQSQFYLGKYKATAQTLRKWAEKMQPSLLDTHCQTIIDAIGRLENYTPHALLVGIDEYNNPEILSGNGAVSSVEKLKQLLISHYGAKNEDIRVLCDHEATRLAILDAFEQLINSPHSKDVPTLFFFAGVGSVSEDGTPTIVSVDGRLSNVLDVDLGDLAAQVSTDTELVTIIDAVWSRFASSRQRTIGSKVKKRAVTYRPKPKEITYLEPLNNANLAIGTLSIFHPTLHDPMTAKVETINSSLAEPLLSLLEQSDIDSLTYHKLLEWNGEILPKFAIGDVNKDSKVFSPDKLKNDIEKQLRKLRKTPLATETIKVVKRVIKRQGSYFPEGYLNLGIAYLLGGEYQEAITALKKAVDQQSEISTEYIGADMHYLGRAYFESRIEADMHYYLGRAYFESETDFSRAVSELRLAVAQNPDNTAAHYYLAEAIRALVERETLVEIEQAYQTYLEQGASVGKRKEVQAFLDGRRNAQKAVQ